MESAMVNALANSTLFKTAGYAADHVQAMANIKRDALPAAFVILDSIDTQRNQVLGGRVNQWLEENFAVWLCVGNTVDANGAAAAQELRAAILESEAMLLGVDSTGYSALEKTGEGRLVGYDNAYLWWVEYYKASRQVFT